MRTAVKGFSGVAAALGLSLALGLGLTVGPWAVAQRPQQGGQGQGAGEFSGDLDKALQSYHSFQERSSKGPDQARQEIERMVKELNELIQMKYQMAVALATQRAEHPATAGGPGHAQPASAAGQSQGQGQGQTQSPGGGGKEAKGSDDDHAMALRKALIHELEQVQNQIRGELDQARNAADQLANQIRTLREQHRGQSGDQHGQGPGQANKLNASPNAPRPGNDSKGGLGRDR
jgi:hypothetical protein